MKEKLLLGVVIEPVVDVFEDVHNYAPQYYAFIEYLVDDMSNGHGEIVSYVKTDGAVQNSFGNWILEYGAKFNWSWNESSCRVILISNNCGPIIETRSFHFGSNAGKRSAKTVIMYLVRECFSLAKFINQQCPTPKAYYQMKAKFGEAL